MSLREEYDGKIGASQPRSQVANVKSMAPMDEALEKLWHKSSHTLETAQLLRGRLDKVMSDPTPTAEDDRKDVAPEQRKTYIMAVENVEDNVRATISVLNDIMDRLLV